MTITREMMSTDELMLECKRLENQYRDFDESVTKLERQGHEYHLDIQSETQQIERLREDCYGDKVLLALVEEKCIALKKVEWVSKELEDTIRSERKKMEQESKANIATLRKQIERNEV
jgi:hypothetical protein